LQIRVDGDAVILPSDVHADQSVEHVVQDALRITRARIAEPAAARQRQAG
jgi:hypothetical protein